MTAGLSLQVSATASFTGDLALDSLDTVELVLAFEDEFCIDMDDSEARPAQRLRLRRRYGWQGDRDGRVVAARSSACSALLCLQLGASAAVVRVTSPRTIII